MDHKDSLIQREEERRRGPMTAEQKSVMESSSRKPRSFRNSPDDPNNPNEARERYLQKIRCLRLS